MVVIYQLPGSSKPTSSNHLFWQSREVIFSKNNTMILLMDEIMHHLERIIIKPCKKKYIYTNNGDKLPTSAGATAGFLNHQQKLLFHHLPLKGSRCKLSTLGNISGQIIIFHQPRFPWNKGISLTKPPFGVRSCEVAIIWPDIDWCKYVYGAKKNTQKHYLGGGWTIPFEDMNQK